MERARLGMGRFVAVLVLCVMALVMIFPFLWMLLSSVKPNSDLFPAGFSLWPKHFTIQHYIDAFREEPWGRYFFNSVFTSTVATLGQVVFAAMAGYSFARLRFPLRNALFVLLLAGLMIPMEVTLVPLFLIIKHFPLVGGNDLLGNGGSGLINTYGGVIVPNLVSIFGVFLMKQFFATLPRSLEEAARIDGCGELRVFWSVMLP